jgi:hypothetical protein
MTTADLNNIIAEIRSAREADDAARLIAAITSIDEERREDCADLAPRFADLTDMVDRIAGVEDWAADAAEVVGWLEHHSFDAQIEAVFGAQIDAALLAAREAGDAGDAARVYEGAEVFVVSDDETPWNTWTDHEGVTTEGLDQFWPQTQAVVYSDDGARSYVSGELVGAFTSPAQSCWPVECSTQDSDGVTQVLVLRTAAGWVVWAL